MFKRVITYRGFWRSVFALGLSFILLFIIFKWIIDGFKLSFFTGDNGPIFFLGAAAAGFVYGFFVTYGKFWKQIKQQDR